MLAKVVVFGIILVMMVGMVVYLVEMFVPLTAKINLNACCRSTLVKMEADGGLTDENRSELVDRLGQKGFENINVTGTVNAGRGEDVSLVVRADYSYSRMTGFFIRERTVQTMSYERVSAARRVVN